MNAGETLTLGNGWAFTAENSTGAGSWTKDGVFFGRAWMPDAVFDALCVQPDAESESP